MNETSGTEDNRLEIETRSLAIRILTEYESGNLSIKHLLRKAASSDQIAPENVEAVHALVLGVVRYLNTIDFLLSRVIRRKSKSMNTEFLCALRLALYEVRWKKKSIQDVISSHLEFHTFGKEIVNRANMLQLTRETAGFSEPERIGVIHSHPSFLVKTLMDNMSSTECIQLLEANNEPRNYCVRPNLLLIDSSEFLEKMNQTRVRLAEDSEIAGVYHVLDGISALVKSDAFKSGEAIIQDKGSVLIAQVLNPAPGEKVWDACAAPGMKTQYLWELMNQQGHIVATDINHKRIRSAKKRFDLLNCQEVEWLHADAIHPVVRQADKILIDAPCSSTGILQSNPSFKWRLNKKTLFELMSIQNKILTSVIESYSEYPGTNIVYATCSLLPHEGESQIDSILKKQRVELLDCPDIGRKGYPGFKCSKSVRRIFPHLNRSNAFFIANLRIKHF